MLLRTDPLTIDERIARLKAAGLHQEAARLSRSARFMSQYGGDNRLQWVNGVLIRELGTGRSWRVLWREGEDYETHLKTMSSLGPVQPALVLAVFQELKDRRLSTWQKDKVWQRLLRRGYRILPVGDGNASLLPGAEELLV